MATIQVARKPPHEGNYLMGEMTLAGHFTVSLKNREQPVVSVL